MYLHYITDKNNTEQQNTVQKMIYTFLIVTGGGDRNLPLNVIIIFPILLNIQLYNMSTKIMVRKKNQF